MDSFFWEPGKADWPPAGETDHGDASRRNRTHIVKSDATAHQALRSPRNARTDASLPAALRPLIQPNSAIPTMIASAPNNE